MTTPIHIPKGSMCMACSHRDATCSFLAFESMPVIERTQTVTVVRCTEFDRQKADWTSNAPVLASV